MKEAQPSLEKQNMSPETPLCCSQCGWPGTGKLPAGVSVIRQKDKTLLVGTLSYFLINTTLCSLCQEMESAVANRPWFVKAHSEYVDEIKVKKQLLGGRD
jgi:hypothetical protein